MKRKPIFDPSSPVAPNGIDYLDGRLIVCENDILADEDGNKYKVIQGLGQGNFSDVYLVTYMGSEYALKVSKSSATEISRAEFCRSGEIQDNIKDDRRFYLGKVEGYFEYKGHVCIILERLGIDIYRFLTTRGLFSLKIVQAVIHDVGKALSGLHSLNVIHADVKPENIVANPCVKIGLKLVDIGGSLEEGEAAAPIYAITRFYRPPEIILGYPITRKADVWSLACTAVELLTGYPLFPGENEHHMLSLIIQSLGRIPEDMVTNSPKRRTFYDDAGELIPEEMYCELEGKPVHEYQYPYEHHRIPKILESVNSREFINLIMMMLQVDPEDRCTIDDVLEHQFMKIQL